MRNGSGTYVAPTNSWNPAINGNLATSGDWQAILNDIVTALTQSVSRDGQTPITGNLQMGNNKITGLTAGSGTGQAVSFEQLFNQGTEQDLASAATTDIGAQLTNFLRITGTTTITSFGTNYKGPRFLRFAGAVTLTNSSTLVLPGGANITTAAGDCLIAIPTATLGTADGWRVVAYQPNSAPVANAMGFKNRLINAQGLINQRGYVSGTATSGANQYTLDRWRVVTSGQSLSFSTTNNVTTFTAPAGGVEQVIEGLNLESGTYVLSWTGTATATVAGSAVTNGGTVTVVGGTNTTVKFSSGTFSLPQFEKGSTATSFDYRPYGTELALCQRYYETGTWNSSGTTYKNNGDTRAALQSFAVTKRAVPTISVNTNSILVFAVSNTGSAINLSGSVDGVVAYANGFSMSTMGNSVNIANAVGGGTVYSWGCGSALVFYASAEL